MFSNINYKIFSGLPGVLFLCALFIIFGALELQAVPSKSPQAGVYMVTTIAGTGMHGSKDGPSNEAHFNWPTGVGGDLRGNLFIADYKNSLIRKIAYDGGGGTVTTFAGGTTKGFNDGKGRDVLFHGPDNISIDEDGNIFVADADNFRIRKIAPDGTVTTIAGNGRRGYKSGPALSAEFAYPTGVALAKDGTLYVADRGTHTVRKISFDKGGEVLVSTVAGNGTPGFTDGRGQESQLNEPVSVAVAPSGVVYIADSGNHSIRAIDKDGLVSTVAGDKVDGYRDGTGADARFAWPTGIAAGPGGNLYICDSLNNKIRKLAVKDDGVGVVTTLAGLTVAGSVDGISYRARFNFPTGIWVSPDGIIYVADSGNNLIRKISRREFAEEAR